MPQREGRRGLRTQKELWEFTNQEVIGACREQYSRQVMMRTVDASLRLLRRVSRCCNQDWSCRVARPSLLSQNSHQTPTHASSLLPYTFHFLSPVTWKVLENQTLGNPFKKMACGKERDGKGCRLRRESV